MKRNLYYFICLFVCAFALAGCQQDASKENKSKTDLVNQSLTEESNPESDKESPLTGKEPVILKEVKVNDQYTFRTYKNSDGCVGYEIINNGKVVYKPECGYMACSASDEDLEGYVGFSPLGKNIIGDNIPNLVVGCITGGSHCCSNITIFSLGNSLKIIKEFNCPYCTFKLIDLDEDGICELIISDSTFQVWGNPSGAGEGYANQNVILRYKNGDYKVALDLMKKFPNKINPPSLKEIANEFGDSEYDTTNPEDGLYELSRYMIALIYSGKGDEAFSFCHKVWPKKRKGEKAFIDAFKKQLTKSPYWSGIKELNGW